MYLRTRKIWGKGAVWRNLLRQNVKWYVIVDLNVATFLNLSTRFFQRTEAICWFPMYYWTPVFLEQFSKELSEISRPLLVVAAVAV